jgi:hypothetical protein
MSRVEAAAAMDRLPWLPDEPPPQRVRRRGAAVIAPLAAIALLVAGAAYWLGSGGVEDFAPPASIPSKPATTVRLPIPRPAVPPQPQVKLAPTPEVQPIVAPPMPVIDSPPSVKRAPVETARPAGETPKTPKVTPLEPWPVRVIEGADGRLVRIGAFSSVHQAKRGWWAIVRVSPALKRLPALVVPVRSLRNGSIYYRLQMGTTSKAHSAVLCQRMRTIAEPCVVIGTTAQE